ncbi:MAG: amidophosphoribosyltransferase [Myxococcota bacterium]
MCGFVGLVGVEPVAPALFLGLQAVQHRGQDACGMGTWDRGHLLVYKDLGKVGDVFTEPVLGTLKGTSGIAHVRYPTVGSSTRNDAQPFMTQRPSIVSAHNGNLVNLEQVYAHLLSRGIRAMSTCDSEPILLELADELLQRKVVDHTEDDLVIAVRRTMELLRGSYSVVAVMEVSGRETLIAFRDPNGIRPAVYGKRSDGAWMVASESVSLDVLDFQRVGDVPPGAVVFLRKGEPPIVREVLGGTPRHCIFEDIYFARPDSVMAGTRVYTRRWELGQQLAEEWNARGLEADVVVAVPDTSRPAAQAMAERLGIAYREGFIKNRYSGRTFIMPDQRARDAAMRLKLNPIDEIFRGQRVVLVDDSIVRGTTMRRIVQMVRKLEPKELHVAIFSPPVAHPCFYGIDMPSRDELVAHRAKIEGGDLSARLAAQFGADTVTFLSERGLRAVAGDRICNACFSGDYPVAVNEDERGYIVRDRRPETDRATPPRPVAG